MPSFFTFITFEFSFVCRRPSNLLPRRRKFHSLTHRILPSPRPTDSSMSSFIFDTMNPKGSSNRLLGSVRLFRVELIERKYITGMYLCYSALAPEFRSKHPSLEESQSESVPTVILNSSPACTSSLKATAVRRNSPVSSLCHKIDIPEDNRQSMSSRRSEQSRVDSGIQCRRGSSLRFSNYPAPCSPRPAPLARI